MAAGSLHDLLNPGPCRCSPTVRQGVVRNLPWTRGAGAGSLADLTFLLRARTLGEGETLPPRLLDEGIFAVVVRGAFKVQRWVGEDQYVIFDILGPGEMFTYGPRDGADQPFYAPPDEVVALTRCCLLTLDLAELGPLLDRDQVLARRFAAQGARRLDQVSARLVRFLALPADQRLTWLLGYLHGKGSPPVGHPGLIPFNLTRRDMAAMTGLTLETASRTVSALERAGVVRSGRGWVEILDFAALERKGPCDLGDP